MKKYLIIILLSVCFSSLSFAQTGQYNQQKDPIAIGIKGGLNIPRMLYFQNEALSRLSQNILFTPTGGLFVEIPVGSNLIIAPEAMYVQRGTDITYKHFSGSQVHYSINASYADLRLPFELRWPIKRYIQPYVLVGAEAGMRLFGQIHIDRTAPIELDQTVEVGDANLNRIHAGVFAGVGLRSSFDIGRMGMVVKLSASIHQGLMDSYSAMEKEGSAQTVNVNAYQITGMRLPQGLEITLGVAIPLQLKQEDACATFSNDRYRHRGSRGKWFGF